MTLPVQTGAAAPSVMFLLFDLHSGGTARVTQIVVNGLAALGWCVTLVVLRNSGALAAATDPRVNVISLDAPEHMPRGPAMLRRLPDLVRAIRRHRPDLLVSSANHMHVMAVLAHRLARLKGCRLVLKMTNTVERHDAGRLANALRRGWYRVAFREAAAVLFISEATRDAFARAGPSLADRLMAVDNPYITDAMIAAAAIPEPYEPGRLLAIGRLVPQKNYGLLLAALARLRARDWTLDVLGDGPLRDTLAAEVERLGIADRVRFQGFIPDPIPFLRRAHALVLSSDWEGQGAVLIEALACGCPVIATSCSEAVDEALGHGAFGMLTPPRDVAALAAAIEAELAARTELPETVASVDRYRIAAGIESHLLAFRRALGQPVAES